jgi:tRNA 2-thiouridine synthesizing protein A
MSQRHSDVTLDLSGLLCPLPVLRARKRLQAMKPGEILCVTATDPMAAIDMPHFCTEQGHRLVAREQKGEALRFWIEARGR